MTTAQSSWAGDVRRLLIALLAVAAISLGRPAAAGAHRLDEYLQATRVSIDIDRVVLEIDLTPGARVATTVSEWIDTDRDGRLSAVESTAYADQVLGLIRLTWDGHPATITLLDARLPAPDDMAAGVGTIRLRGIARIASTSGHHELTYVNAHRAQSSLYLVNALVPSDRRITIASQQRDPAQHRLTLEYDVAHAGWRRALTPVAGLSIVALLVLPRRWWPRSGRRLGSRLRSRLRNGWAARWRREEATKDEATIASSSVS
jgi:hypothetical protein